jgi:2'-5' RNA ligase
LRPLIGMPIAAEWPAAGVCLVESRLSPKGANYEVLETVSLK